MTAYRFCRSDDMGLLVEAYERCRGPEDEGEPALDRDGFKRLVRDLDLWCSSCMVAFEGREPVGVLLGAKRPEATLIYALRVHPGHRRRGHGRHLLTSLSQKLAILGPPRQVAEVPAEREAARAIFSACGFQLAGRLIDWRRNAARPRSAASGAREALAPVSVADLEAAGLLGTGPRCWQRDLPALAKHGERLSGLAFHSPDRIEAWALWDETGTLWAAGAAPGPFSRIGLPVVLDEINAPLLLPRATPEEVDADLLAELGFESGPEHLLFTSRAQAA
ncbi:MAG: GNAT family N-acetyltransferase [Thermoanaerobaculia bacterium]